MPNTTILPKSQAWPTHTNRKSGYEDAGHRGVDDLADRIETLECEREDLDNSLVKAQTLLRRTVQDMNALPVAWVIIDHDATILFASAMAQALLALDRHENNGQAYLYTHMDRTARHALRDHLGKMVGSCPMHRPLSPQETYNCDVELAVEGNSPKSCIMTVAPFRARTEQPERFVATLVEVTQRRACRRSEALSALMAEETHLLQLRAVDEILSFQDGPSALEDGMDPPFDLGPEDIETAMHALDIEVLVRQSACSRLELPTAATNPLILHKFPVYGPGREITHVGTIAFGLSNMGGLVAQQFITHDGKNRAEMDPLTGCATRSAILGQLETEIAKARRAGSVLSIVCVDLDSFKSFNDGLGHQFGDALLKSVAARLTEGSGPNGSVGRLSGDEFLILLPGNDQATASELLKGLTDSLRQPLVISGTELISTCSMGLACFPQHGGNGVELIRAADLALYRSKSLGRNMVTVFEERMNSENERKFKIMKALHRAVARDEFHLVFQPQYDIADRNRLIGVEALLRWTDMDMGAVPPMEFISLGHQCGLGLSIDLWVFKNALRQKAAWKEHCNSLTMSINASASSFLSLGFASNVLSMIRLYNLDPRLVQIEVTESTLMQKAENCANNLRALREAGVSISVDDFGTGFSSLAQIHKLMPSELKIDREFVSRIDQGDAVAIKPLELILSLARTLGMRTVAEGIETEEQFAWLAENGCEVGQGFLLSQPLPGDQLRFCMDRTAA